MKYVVALLALLLAAPLVSHAQLGVYAGFSTSSLDVANTSRLYGGTFGAYYDDHHFPLVNFGLDLRGTVLPSDNITSVTTVTAGPRAVFHLPIVPIRPYVEGLIGGGHVNSGQGVARYDSGTVVGGAAAGVDLHVLPYIDWRVIDFSYNRLFGPHDTQKTFTTGLVLRIPFS